MLTSTFFVRSEVEPFITWGVSNTKTILRDRTVHNFSLCMDVPAQVKTEEKCMEKA
jgi:hypothetical protein